MPNSLWWINEQGAGGSSPCRGLGQRPKTCAAARNPKHSERQRPKMCAGNAQAGGIPKEAGCRGIIPLPGLGAAPQNPAPQRVTPSTASAKGAGCAPVTPKPEKAPKPSCTVHSSPAILPPPKAAKHLPDAPRTRKVFFVTETICTGRRLLTPLRLPCPCPSSWPGGRAPRSAAE